VQNFKKLLRDNLISLFNVVTLKDIHIGSMPSSDAFAFGVFPTLTPECQRGRVGALGEVFEMGQSIMTIGFILFF